MPIVLADANLPQTTTDGFFNDLEDHVRDAILAGGSGHYKLAREKNDGNFTSATLVTEANDAAALEASGDRFAEVGETEDYLYVNFLV